MRSIPGREAGTAFPPHAILAVLACAAIAFPTLIAFNVAAVGDVLQPGGGAWSAGAASCSSSAPALPARRLAALAGALALLAALALSACSARCRRRSSARVPWSLSLSAVGHDRCRALAGRRGRRLGAARRPGRARLSRVLHRPGRRRRRQQPDRPRPGVRADAARRRLDRARGDRRAGDRQPAPAEPPEQPAAVVDRRRRLARRGEGRSTRARRRGAGARCSSTSSC